MEKEDMDLFMKKRNDVDKILEDELDEMMKEDKTLKDNKSKDSIDRNFINYKKKILKSHK